MKKQHGSAVLVLIVWLVIVTPWFVNAFKFVDCDFESDYKCEAIHGIGIIIPPASWITVWFADDES